MSPPISPPRRAGFTLVEMLISMTLLSLVMTLVYTSFGQVSTRALAMRDLLTEQQELRLLMRLVSDDIAAAQWLSRFSEKSNQLRTGIIADTQTLQGEEFTRIRFHAARPARFHRRLPPGMDPALHEVEYFVRPARDGDTLEMVRREDFYLDDDMDDGGLSVVVAENIKSFLVEFIPPRAQGGGTEESWRKSWDSNTRNKGQRMPRALRLTLARETPAGIPLREVIEVNLNDALKL